jgi:valyl-tRNA synthetase
MRDYLDSMANAELTACGPEVAPPATSAAVTVRGMDVIVDLSDLIDVGAEIERNQQHEKKLAGQIDGKKKKLSNASFVERAPVDIVQKERESLAQLEEQLTTVRSALAELQKRVKK